MTTDKGRLKTAADLLDELLRRGATRIAGGSNIESVRDEISPWLESPSGWVIREAGPNHWLAVELTPEGRESDRHVAFRGGPR